MDAQKIINKAISNVLNDKERMKDPFAKALMLAIKEYVETGHKLSDLSFFKGSIFEKLDNAYTVNETIAA